MLNPCRSFVFIIIQYKHGEIEMSAEKAAEQKEMTHTVEAIQYLVNQNL